MQKKYKIALIAASAILAIGIVIWLCSALIGGSKSGLSSIEVKNGDISKKINLTGQVKASQGVDLAFESQGRIVKNYVKVGDKIYAGQPLLAIDSSVLQSQLKQAQAQLDALNIDVVESKTNVSLESLYINSLSTLQKSISTTKDILLPMSDIQYNHFLNQNQQNINLQKLKTEAVYSLLGQADAGLWTSETLSQLDGGAYNLVQIAVNNPTNDNIDSALYAGKIAMQDVSNLINAIPMDASLTSAEKTSINSAKATINAEIMTTSANIQSIAALKVNNSATIITTNSQIEAAKAAVDTIETQISKTVITALFNGQVDKNDAVIGQIVSANVPVITISNNNLEIATNIPEVDLPSAKVGGTANITLDTYGNDVVFPATIYSVNSTPTTINGIPTYGAKLKFNDLDERIKPGMTANITLISDTRVGVLTIPKSAVIKNNGKYFVIMDNGEDKETREITIGTSDDQNIEVISGLGLGERIFIY